MFFSQLSKVIFFKPGLNFRFKVQASSCFISLVLLNVIPLISMYPGCTDKPQKAH